MNTNDTTNSHAGDRELARLVEALLDETITEAEVAELERRLAADVAARSYYLDRTMLRTLLEGEAGTLGGGAEVDASEPTVNDVASTKPRPRSTAAAELDRGSPFRRSLALAVAATALVAVVVWTWWGGANATSPAAVARLEATAEARWSDPHDDLAVGAALPPGPLHLQSGTASIAMESGATLELVGPVEIELRDAKAIRLLRGTLRADVPEAAIGFRVLTPTADVVDMGTEFALTVEDEGATEVHVLQGVVVTRSTETDAVVPILAREAGRVDLEHGDIVAIPWDAKRFGPRSAQPSPRPRNADVPPLPAGSRVIFLGDAMTDRETHILLVNEALVDLSADSRPQFFNAGLSFLLSYPEEEFDEYVASLRPTHAVLEFGPEIATGPKARTADEFRRDVTRLVDRLEREGIEPIIETGFPLVGEQAKHQPRLDRYNASLRKLGEERGYRLVEVEPAMQAALQEGRDLHDGDGDRLSFEGYRHVAAALLEAFGHPQAEIGRTLQPAPLPGVLLDWTIRFRETDEPLTADEVRALEPDDDWERLVLPQPTDRFTRRLAHRSHSRTARDRERGFATHLHRRGSKGLVGITHVESAVARRQWLNVGAGVRRVWVNDELVYHDKRWGWHAGKDRLPVDLHAGTNRLVVETGTSFFVSLTDECDWPLP